MFIRNYTQHLGVTQLKYSHHERCLSGVLWVSIDETRDEQQGESKDADKHQTPCFHAGHSIKGLCQYDT